MNVSPVRKALAAGLGAALTAAVAAYGPAHATRDDWIKILAAALAAGVVVGWTTWRVPNIPARAEGEVRPLRGPQP